MTQPLDNPHPARDLSPALEPIRGSTTLRTSGPESVPYDGTLPHFPSMPGPPSVPGYEILGELGRGGMGVVYKARQLKANRLVALKMILVGGHAGAPELARFQNEARALAALQLPNIVQVFDVGEHDGLPFFSLEFCPGGSLDRKLAGTPLPPNEAARLVETLARAMHAAHQAGVIHRDLKPANVLLAASGLAEQPTSKITDFGLAKKLDDDAAKTRSGAIMGTPSYMAPEQASGDVNQIGTSADLYALGAILYECLTGRPPFKAATVMDTLNQVIHDEPVPPSQLQSKTPRDLETICLKCLQKDPGKRYPTVCDLADDLGRFLRNEPISARPLGRLERAWRWCRRNPAVASLLTAVLLVFAAGATVSALLFIRAERRADEAVEARRQAQEDEEKARKSAAAETAARIKEEEANKALLESTDNLVTSVALAKLGPLAVQVQPKQPMPPVNQHEIAALWDIASSDEKRLPFRFVKVALREPGTTRQFGSRAAVALHAAVGLNATRRADVEELLSEHLQASTTSVEQKENVALCLAHLGNLDRTLAVKTAATFIQAMTKTTDPYALQYLSHGLSAVSSFLERQDAVSAQIQAADFLIQAIGQTRDDSRAIYALSDGLSSLALRMEQSAAAETAAKVAQVMGRTNPSAMSFLAQALSAVAARMEPRAAARVCSQAATTLTQAMNIAKDDMALRNLAQALSPIAARMDPKEAAAILSRQVLKPTYQSALYYMSRTFLAVAHHLAPNQAAEAANEFAQALSKSTDSLAMQPLSECLAALVSYMSTDDATKAATALSQALSKNTVQGGSMYLSAGLAAVADRMLPGEAAALLLQSMSKTADAYALRRLAQKISEVSSRLEPQEAARLRGRTALLLIQYISTTTVIYNARLMSEGLLAVTTNRDPKETTAAAATLAQALNRGTQPLAIASLSVAFSELAPHLDPNAAAEAAGTLSQLLSKATNPLALEFLSQGLTAVAPHLDPKAAPASAAALFQALSKSTDPVALAKMSVGLAALASHLERRVSAAACGQAAAALVQLMSKTTIPHYLRILASGLAKVAAHLEPQEAGRMCGEAARILSRTTTNPKNPSDLQSLTHGLSELAARMEPNDAALVYAQTADSLIQAMNNTTEGFTLRSYSQQLAALVATMEPRPAADACARAAAALTRAMDNPSQSNSMQIFTDGFSMVVSRLELKPAAENAAAIIQAMSRTSDPRALDYLSQCLTAVLSREATTTSRQRPLSATATLAALTDPSLSFLAFACAQPAFVPSLPPLPPPTLIELLKHPVCVAEPRRLVLEQLSRHYHRPFRDQWDFVDYVHKKSLDLDLLTPPQRPERAAAR